MEIEITSLAKTAELSDLSASQAELGKDAGKITWANAKAEASMHPLISTDDELAAFREWAKEFGAWEDDEIDEWSSDECNALLIQYIAGDLRTLESCGFDESDEYGIDWKAVDEQLDGGNSVYKGDDGKLYFYMGS